MEVAVGTTARTARGTRRTRGHAPASGACWVCRGSTAYGYAMCRSCRDVAVALGRAPLPVAAIALVDAGSDLYRALRQYKSGEPSVAERQRARLARILASFAERRLAAVAPGGVDATVVVPSDAEGRPPPHPLAAVLQAATGLPPVADLLRPTGSVIGHRRPAADAYRAAAAVTGRRVLLVDDVYTTGAHLQSAAAALVDGGAAAVHPLVLARFVRAPGSGAGAGSGRGAGSAPGAGAIAHHSSGAATPREAENSVPAPRGMGMGMGGRHLTDR